MSATPPAPSTQSSGAGLVRRHHTISAASRTRGAGRNAIAEESVQPEHPDEQVNDDWTPGPVGVVGEKSTAGLHRQASLPTGYHRGFQSARAPKHMPSLNSLSAIDHEHEEEDWEKEMPRGLRNEEELQIADASGDGTNSAQSPTSPLGSGFAHGHHAPSPPIADSGVRRHQSMTAGHGSVTRRTANGALKRSGTLQTPGPMRNTPHAARSPSPTNAEEEYEQEEEDAAYVGEDAYYRSANNTQQNQQGNNNGYAPSPLGRSPWATPGEWRQQQGTGSLSGHPEELMDDVSRALSNLELSSNQGNAAMMNMPGFPTGQSVHPPRFNPMHPPPQQMPGMRGLPPQQQQQQQMQGSRKLALVTDMSSPPQSGPASAAAYMPAIGQGVGGGAQTPGRRGGMGEQQPLEGRRERSYSAHSSGGWEQKEHALGGRTSNPNLKYAYDQGGANIPSVPPIPAQYLNQGQNQPRIGVTTSFGQGVQGQVGGPMQDGQMPGVTSPVDIPTLIATKGYNPVNFDIKPTFARYFVIKSYTEDDVHKSIKYEIWSSTDPGNKRLDKAFKETAGRGPIYLFFSVNASGHFCGMAEMLTPVDYTRSSTVWASDKWKGVFKVRWIFVRDIPNAALRHIKLNNTQERKPVTNSRDTQELLPEAGHEMLRIFHTHMARTSLLQDFSYYELQAAQKTQQQFQQTSPQGPVGRMQSPQPGMQQPQQQLSPTLQPQQHPFAMANPTALAYTGQQLSPMMGMATMQGMSPGAVSPQQYAAAMQGSFRHASPGPPGGQQQFMGMPGF